MRLKKHSCAVWLVAAAALMCWAQDGATGQGRAERRLQERLEEVHRREAEALVELTDRLMAGQTVASDFAMDWRHHFLKAQPGTFVPFTITVEPSALRAPKALMYVRVARRLDGSRTRKAAERKNRKSSAERFAFDAVFPVDLTDPGTGAVRISRGFAVAPGEYDVYVALRERPVGSDPRRLKAGILRRPLTVPDYWTGELAASTVMLADRIDVLPRPLEPDEALERPFVIGQNDVHVAAEPIFPRDRELIVVFVIYNPTVTADRRFDIQVDYHLYQHLPPGRPVGGSHGSAGAPPARVGERYVTRTDPQRFNPSVLGTRLDPAAGHPVMAGQGILLTSFEEGEYRLGITVTDLLSRRTLTRDVTFTVVGS